MRQKNATGIRNGKTRGTRGNQDNHTPGDLRTDQFDHRGNGKEEKSIQDVTNTWVCICGTDDCIVLTLRVLAFTSAGIIFANACTNGICIAGAEPDKPRQHRGHHPTTQKSPSSQLPHWASRLRTTKGRAAG